MFLHQNLVLNDIVLQHHPSMHHTTNFFTPFSLQTPIIEFEVLLEDKPALFVEINEPRKIALKSVREEADNQMRKRMGDLAPSCPPDTLNGVSAFGTRRALPSTLMTNKLAFFRYCSIGSLCLRYFGR